MTEIPIFDQEKFKLDYAEALARQARAVNINSYLADGFEKVCDVIGDYNEWQYKNINRELMYSTHKSWVYFVVENEEIVKCGETGNPLGIRETYGSVRYETQPVGSSKCRFGRLRKGDGTDGYIRESLYDRMKAGYKISLWAKKCRMHVLKENIGGIEQKVDTSFHKSLEQMYLNNFKFHTGNLPRLNKASK
jgi:hypothetical protein